MTKYTTEESAKRLNELIGKENGSYGAAWAEDGEVRIRHKSSPDSLVMLTAVIPPEAIERARFLNGLI